MNSTFPRRAGYGISLEQQTGNPADAGKTFLADNPFGISELEPFLRPYDLDALTLKSRLPDLIPSVAFDNVKRHLITTDAWDLPVPGTTSTDLNNDGNPDVPFGASFAR